MDDTTILGGALNQLGQAVKQSAKQAVKIPEEMAKDAGGQIGALKPAVSAEGSGEPKQWQSDEERIKFLKDLYGKSDMSQDGAVNPSADASAFVKTTVDKKAMADKEEQKKLIELRQQLHKDVYYDPTFNPVKKQEERPAEKVEAEKKQEMMDLQKKEDKKPQPLAVVREQNKAEMFRGAAG
ncbi:MAG: hypothetical protein HW400_67 [Candidatus Levybacteria bacterium]|nr:hypothetical protein [Candidatus Levybacteria bacterium]